MHFLHFSGLFNTYHVRVKGVLITKRSKACFSLGMFTSKYIHKSVNERQLL